MAHTAHSMSDWLKYLSNAEVDLLKKLTLGLPDNPVVVNIGAGSGTSGLAFMEAREDITLVTIDIRDEAHPLGSLESERVALKDAGLFSTARNHYIHGESQKIADTFTAWAKANLGKARTHVDMVFVDGDHTLEGASADITGWLEHLKKGGVMAVHDYQKKERWVEANPGREITPEVEAKEIKAWTGVDQAVGELLLDKYVHIATVDTLIAFKKEALEPQVAPPAKKPVAPKPQPVAPAKKKATKKKT